MAKILVFNGHFYGEYCDVRSLPAPGATVAASNLRRVDDGGKGSNVAVAIGRLGGSVAFLNRCGDDDGGHFGFACMQEAGVDLRDYILDPSISTNSSLCIVAQNGQNMILNFVSEDNTLSYHEIHQCLDDYPDAEFLISGFEVPIDRALYAMKKGKEHGLHTILNASPLDHDDHLDPIPYVDTLVINEVEANILLGRAPDTMVDVSSAAANLRQTLGVRNVIITLGSKGSYFQNSESCHTASPYPIRTVDTVGAGDGYLAALTWRLSEGDSFAEAMDWASRYAAYVCSQMGTIGVYPTLSQLEEFLVRNPPLSGETVFEKPSFP